MCSIPEIQCYFTVFWYLFNEPPKPPALTVYFSSSMAATQAGIKFSAGLKGYVFFTNGSTCTDTTNTPIIPSTANVILCELSDEIFGSTESMLSNALSDTIHFPNRIRQQFGINHKLTASKAGTSFNQDDTLHLLVALRTVLILNCTHSYPVA